MQFLEAQRTLAEFTGGEPLPFLLGMSGTPDPLRLFIRAVAARQGFKAEPRTRPFNTLAQTLITKPESVPEVFLLLPSDLLPEAEWRSGLPTAPLDTPAAHEQVKRVIERLVNRPEARTLYLPAPLPPLLSDPAANGALAEELLALMRSHGARVLPQSAFSLGNYLSSGNPIASARVGEVAATVVDALRATRTPCKVLVTDLDNVMWHGVIGEEGPEGVRYEPEGLGFRHFIYQTFLAKLRREGTLIAAVSRNDPDLALAPFRGGRMMLKESDLVTVLAGYGAKSAQIEALARQLDLGLDAFAFVDDNPVELAEVGQRLPSVHCVPFPAGEDELPPFFDRLASLFARPQITDEDRSRTELYRRRLKGMAPENTKGADLTAFLRGLEMVLTVSDHSRGNRQRAVQLINKTNQFNLNGRRLEDDEVAEVLEGGGCLFTAHLADHYGSHGEILACLIDGEGIVRSLVMSCRVLERRVEHAFLAWLAGQPQPPRALDFRPTERNEPLRRFLDDPAFDGTESGLTRLDVRRFASDHADDLNLFRVETERTPT